jgi:hypothetical protein
MPRPMPPKGSGFYPNLPATWSTSRQINFSDAVPADVGGSGQAIGSTGFTMVPASYTFWTKTSDATAPQSQPDTWVGHMASGSYGGGVVGSGSGHGIGGVLTALSSITRLYASVRIYFDYPDTSFWHSISNKFLFIQGDTGLILVQLSEGGYWLHAEELASPTSIFVDPGTDHPGEDHIPGQLSNTTVPVGQWMQIEVEIDLVNHIFKIWRDGTLTTDATPTFTSTAITEFKLDFFRGGGGETLTSDLNWKIDHIYLAW